MNRINKIIFILIIIISFLLRFYKLTSSPPSLNWDEVSLGYNAYSIATSLRDEHGEFLPLARFIAFGDNKPPGYIYATVPSIWIFGLNEFSVRLPSIIAGLLMVFITYLLVKEFFNNETIALLSSFFLAISPWAIQFSRAAFEANLASFFNLAAIYLFVLSKRKKWSILLSVIFFIFSFYTFNANRIIAPLLLIGLSVIFLKDLLSNLRWVLVSFIIAIILIFPSISYLKSRESKIRFQEVSIFNNLEIIINSNQRMALDNKSLLARIFHNRRVSFAVDFLKHYSDNFHGRFLFTHGDVNPRLSVQSMGELYVWEALFLILGTFFIIKNKEKSLWVILLWMAIVPIPAGTAKETPHALRILSILPTYQILIAYGLYYFLRLIRKRTFKRLLYLALSCLLSVNIFYYLHDFYIHYPIDWSGEWQYGYKEMISYVSKIQNNYDYIFVTNAMGRPYIYFAFYQKIPLSVFLQEREATRDWFGFWNVSGLGKIKFEFDQLAKVSGRILLVTTKGNLPDDYKLLETIENLSGESVFMIAEKR